MTRDPAAIADRAIGLFLAYRDEYGCDDEVACRDLAVAEVMTDHTDDLVGLYERLLVETGHEEGVR